MTTWMRDTLGAAREDLRAHPVPQRVRALVGTTTVVDSTAALLVWEPRRIVPSYAVPVAHVAAETVDAAAGRGEEHAVQIDEGGSPVLDPSTGFGAHTTDGTALDLRTPEAVLDGAAFAPDDPALRGYVVLDWAAFDHWLEEDEEMVGHPHDPFSRIDCLASDRHVEVAVDGQVLADSRRPVMLLETWLPPRYYLPWDDVRDDLLDASDTTSVCAYKGTARSWSYASPGEVGQDVAWSYPSPRHDATPVAGMVAFFDERVDRRVDGVAQERPVTPWS
ncbi:DUF427 domain-containing protein [Mumia quercus]|uniref:DUF427 domain-containing protein n=1 Tax=Mumia quercus TaxID=2976125 RepID=UPI0021CF0F8F|nr:DUF427 domain-containing protein [Mumia quercus]